LGWCDRVLGRAALRVAAAVAVTALLSGCGLLSGPTALQNDDPQTMTVTSPDFGQGRAVPNQYTCHGQGETPPLNWSNAPQGTKALALVLDDADAPITPYVYWIVFNISPATPELLPGRPPPTGRQAYNSKDVFGYTPPCPDRSHKYRFTVYALNAPLHLGEKPSLTAAWSAIASHAIAWGRLTAVVKP
jgi:Raf kinase inhibitor-like YbhB/YbcL family protein